MSMTSSSPQGVHLRAQTVSKSFDQREVLHALNLDIAPGEFVAIVGRSGCGKSTLLRLVAGLEQPSQGQLVQDLQPIDGLNTQARIMFQEARLLPWRTVLDNVVLGLPNSQHALAVQLLEQVGLAGRAQDWPAHLSGGQRQRAALARALVHQPQLLLLDEPLGALDALTRMEMHRLIEALWQQRGFTALLVTHDVQEAVTLADRVVLIEAGRIAWDEPINLPRPRSHGDPTLSAIAQRILQRLLQPQKIHGVAQVREGIATTA
ncbi:MAG: ATP-binding cassette domain-containing protein [Acidovorax sp.]|nr:ATP-binding cassette domain-containing protein [Acidovorax sp.]